MLASHPSDGLCSLLFKHFILANAHFGSMVRTEKGCLHNKTSKQNILCFPFSEHTSLCFVMSKTLRFLLLLFSHATVCFAMRSWRKDPAGNLKKSLCDWPDGGQQGQSVEQFHGWELPCRCAIVGSRPCHCGAERVASSNQETPHASHWKPGALMPGVSLENGIWDLLRQTPQTPPLGGDGCPTSHCQPTPPHRWWGPS